MKVIIKSVIFVLLNIAIVAPASAGSFSDSFKSWVLNGEASASVTKAETVNLDASSAECMQCHDGRSSGHIVVKSANSAMQFTASGRQSNHPIGMNYAGYAVSNPASYRSRATLDPNIRLVSGRVACVSCHQAKEYGESARHGLDSYLKVSTVAVSNRGINSTKMKLTVGPRVTDLCMGCHTI